MNKKELINLIMEQHSRYTKNQAETALQSVVDAIQTALSYGDPVVLTGFGKFYTVRVPLHTVVNPQTLEMIDVPEHTAAKFRPGAVLKKLVNNGWGYRG
jgi:DNA-binding protein HU-beta